jgi:hypothetical protein
MATHAVVPTPSQQAPENGTLTFLTLPYAWHDITPRSGMPDKVKL